MKEIIYRSEETIEKNGINERKRGLESQENTVLEEKTQMGNEKGTCREKDERKDKTKRRMKNKKEEN